MRHHLRMPKPKRLPAQLDGRIFTLEDARAHGVGRERLRRSDLRAPFRGVREPASGDATTLGRCQAYAALGMAGKVFSHATAAELHGMPLPRRLEQSGEIHVASIDGSREPRMKGVIGHRIVPSGVTLEQRHGCSVPSAVETWCQLASILSIDELIVAGDFILGCAALRIEALATLDELRVAVDRRPGRRGAGRMREAILLVREGSASPLETRVRLLLQRAGFPEFELNAPIRDATGRIVALGDLVIRAFRLVIEVEGGHHLTSKAQWDIDLDRLNEIAALNITVVRVSGDHVRDNPARVIRTVRAALTSRGWRP
jgi:hypothetical protein